MKITMKALLNKNNNVMGIYENEIPADMMKKANRYGWTIREWNREVYENNAEKGADMDARAEMDRKAYVDAYDKKGY